MRRHMFWFVTVAAILGLSHEGHTLTLVDSVQIADPSVNCCARAVAITPDGTTALVVVEGSAAAVTLVDLPSRSVVGFVPLNGFLNPRAVTITPDGRTALVPVNATQSLDVIDVA